MNRGRRLLNQPTGPVPDITVAMSRKRGTSSAAKVSGRSSIVCLEVKRASGTIRRMA